MGWRIEARAAPLGIVYVVQVVGPEWGKRMYWVPLVCDTVGVTIMRIEDGNVLELAFRWVRSLLQRSRHRRLTKIRQELAAGVGAESGLGNVEGIDQPLPLPRLQIRLKRMSGLLLTGRVILMGANLSIALPTDPEQSRDIPLITKLAGSPPYDASSRPSSRAMGVSAYFRKI